MVVSTEPAGGFSPSISINPVLRSVSIAQVVFYNARPMTGPLRPLAAVPSRHQLSPVDLLMFDARLLALIVTSQR
ncbi:hypothetical protein M404DRAFT_1001368 [Pisolithus tinctorius Marx 270]|uniref:Uncharacterized protein n=1 Tax=Pisolithus tinctorius Marx 270 TaxID=870435 RepID=A0A0C3P775_PISTI|nr:hypothetical protein M404DRAFT_1001368 [Pisolithus tinctorius Marx 270]